MKKFRLNFRSVPEEHLSAMASETLHDGDYVEPPREPEAGDTMPDGTIYAGISPDTGKAMFATPADAPLSYTFNEATKYAGELDAYGHQDWHLPTKGELNVLFNNRAAIGGFNVTGSDLAGWYWSSSQINRRLALVQRFSDGSQNLNSKGNHSSLRRVRT
jgi:hypothetical protein